jgi:hypothetical protein
MQPACRRPGRRRTALAIAVTLFVTPIGARADWEFTKWGMTLRDVRKAAPVPVKVSQPAERVLKRIARDSSVLAYTPDFAWQGEQFELRFGFDAHARLNAVFLVADARRFAPLEAALIETLGDAASRAETPAPCRSWVDAADGDHVRLRNIGVTLLERAPRSDVATGRCLNAEHETAKPD